MPLPFICRFPPLALSSSPVKVPCLLGSLAVVQSVAPSASSMASCLAPGLAFFTAPHQCFLRCCPLLQLLCCPAGPSPSSSPCQLSCTATRESAATLSQELLTGCFLAASCTSPLQLGCCIQKSRQHPLVEQLLLLLFGLCILRPYN